MCRKVIYGTLLIKKYKNNILANKISIEGFLGIS